jgi:hypothetical protein
MQDISLNSLTASLSEERLSSYRHTSTENEERVLKRYEFNLQLSKQLYTSLHILEVVLRNSIHKTFCSIYGTDNWFQIVALLQSEVTQIQEAHNKIHKANHSITSNRIVAELTFGFWTGLFQRDYEQRIWYRNNMLQQVFPYYPRRYRTRNNLSKKLNNCRKLRNRVFHYEPIWRYPKLQETHQDIVDLVGAIDKEAHKFLIRVDQFPTKYQDFLSFQQR